MPNVVDNPNTSHYKISPDEIKRLLHEEMPNVPENLQDLYLKELINIAISTHARLNRVLEGLKKVSRSQNIYLEQEVKTDIAQWIDMQQKTSAYASYSAYMKQNSGNPYTFDRFCNRSSQFSCYENWLKIEKDGLQFHPEVMYGEETWEIAKITTNYRVSIKSKSDGKHKNTHPGALKVVKQSSK